LHGLGFGPRSPRRVLRGDRPAVAARRPTFPVWF
jgi:hypothetical protein